jgi:Protein of unknown function (DUF3224)
MRKRLQVSAVLAAVLAVLWLPTSAGAAPPADGSGTFTVSSTVVTSTRQADGNTFLTLRVTTLYGGTLQGTGLGEETVVVHPDGTLNGRTFETFTGTVGGVAGTATLRVEGTGDTTTGALRGQFTIVGGTGGLANLRGGGTFQGVGESGTYTIAYTFAPAP